MKVRYVLAFIVALTCALSIAFLLLSFAVSDIRTTGLGDAFLSLAVDQTRAVNVVSGVLLDFRAFDTLGEASVIFASVAAVSAAFSGSTLRPSERGLGLLVRRSVSYLSPLFLLFPVYIVFHGHLSPGGGFQGGVSLAVLLILLTVAFGTRNVSGVIGVHALHAVEALSAGAFLLVGVVGVLQGLSFLTNLAAGFPPGEVGGLFSAGMIPLLNLVIGAKVASGLGAIFFDLLSTGGGG
ncbi:MAG: hydrogen gas-evolving membrane-bound hydrogenase subunit E [Spirochaetota bacterium]